ATQILKREHRKHDPIPGRAWPQDSPSNKQKGYSQRGAYRDPGGTATWTLSIGCFRGPRFQGNRRSGSLQGGYPSISFASERFDVTGRFGRIIQSQTKAPDGCV